VTRDIWSRGGIIRDIMLVPLPLADSNALINFLIFHISIFLSDSWPSAMLINYRPKKTIWLPCIDTNQLRINKKINHPSGKRHIWVFCNNTCRTRIECYLNFAVINFLILWMMHFLFYMARTLHRIACTHEAACRFLQEFVRK